MKPLHLAMILAIDVVWGCNIVAVKEGVMSAGPFSRGMWSTWTSGGSIGGWGSEEAERGGEEEGTNFCFRFFLFSC